jgi:iron complex outermembrane receptor protein
MVSVQTSVVASTAPGRGRTRPGIAVVLFAAALVIPASARGQSRPPDLTTATLEDLMNIRITSASRKEQTLIDTAAAVYVITGEEIRRSGLTLVPEMLRLAPGVHVAHIDANKWAIAIRGFNTRWSDKLLVLVDGRTIYDRVFSGVHWEAAGLMAEDIDRIEVIRGPGGAVWGANAVNGVINIITRSASQTPGFLMRAGAADDGSFTSAFRYGGRAGEGAYRVHFEAAELGPGRLAAGGDSTDDWRYVNGGIRLDWRGRRDDLTLTGNGLWTRTGTRAALLEALTFPPVRSAPDWRGEHRNGSVLARWTRRIQNGRRLELQSFADVVHRVEPQSTHHATTIDIDGEYETWIGRRHQIVAGAGYRWTRDRVDGGLSFSLTQDEMDLTVFNVFAQDEIRFADERVRVTVGTKVERETLSGWNVQPTARALWQATTHQRLWAAFSRATRSPSRVDVGMRVNADVAPGQGGPPLVVGVLGNPDYQTEDTRSLEVGYRLDLGPVSLDAAGFRSEHERLRTIEPGTPFFESIPGPPHLLLPLRFGNLLRAETAGVELVVRLAPGAWWHVDGGYTYFQIDPTLSPESRDTDSATTDGAFPRHQWQVRPAVTFGGWEADLSWYRVGAIESLAVPAYTRIDTRVEWRIRPTLSVILTGQNLTDRGHAEFAGDDIVATPSMDQRRVGLSLRWRPR